MLKRILVALDPDQDTQVATRFAKELAKAHDARVSGLAVVDTRGIAREVGPGGAVGATYYAEKVREQLTSETRAAAAGLVEAFEHELDVDHVAHDEHVRDGVPARRIVEDTKYHDLLVVGREPHFFYPDAEKRTHTLARIVKGGISPTLVVPDTYRTIRRVLIAYDGSGPSARTLQKFAQLAPFGKDLEVEIVNVREGESTEAQQESELILMLAGAYLRAHGFGAIRESSLHVDEAGRRILEHARSGGFDLIVAGAHSVSAVKRLAFGSTTHLLTRECMLPMFIYH